MSFGWFSSVIQTAPSMAETVLPAPSTTFRVWFGPSFTAPFLSSSFMVHSLFSMRRMHPAQPALKR